MFGAVAERKGFFTQEGLNAELIRIGGNIMVPALANGDIDYTLMFGSVVRATLSGFPFKGVASFVDAPTGALVGKAGVTAQNLKGKTIAVSSFGAGAHVTAVLTVQHLNINPNEVKFVAAGGTRIAWPPCRTVSSTPRCSSRRDGSIGKNGLSRDRQVVRPVHLP